MNSIPAYQMLRDQWALKVIITEGHIDSERMRDKHANPHNESYHNKKPIRDTAEIVSDLAYTYADEVLKHQYGSAYTNWLTENGYTSVWGVTKQRG